MAAETTKVTINLAPYTGEYEFDWNEAPTGREWHWIKQFSGHLPRTIDTGDPMFCIVFAAITLRRAGKIDRDQVLDFADKVADYAFDGSVLKIDWGSDDENPPELTSERDEPSTSASLTQNESSGNDSRNDSAPSEDVPSLTGTSR